MCQQLSSYTRRGAYAGWTVASVVMMADMVVGGCVPAEGNLSILVEALTLFNEAFVDGIVVSDQFTVPGCEDGGGGGGWRRRW